jgi:hypothetical protein
MLSTSPFYQPQWVSGNFSTAAYRLIHPSGKIPPERPIAEVTDASLGFVYGTSVYQANHALHILDTQGEETFRVGNDRLKQSGSRGRMDLYVSCPKSTPTPGKR